MLKIYRLNKNQNTFEVTIKFKGVGVHVSFVDGNTYNGTPAKCYTNDAFKQRAIESSQMFKDREITLERSVEENSDRKAVEAKTSMKSVTRHAPKAVEKKIVQKPAPKPEIPNQNPPLEPEPEDEVLTEPESMEFANLGEAILYIAQNWQTEAKTEKEAREILKAHGINPKIKKG